MAHALDEKQVNRDTAMKMEAAGYGIFIRERDENTDYFVWLADFNEWKRGGRK